MTWIFVALLLALILLLQNVAANVRITVRNLAAIYKQLEATNTALGAVQEELKQLSHQVDDAAKDLDRIEQVVVPQDLD